MKEQMKENKVTEQEEEKVVETFGYEYAQNGVPNQGEKKEKFFLGFLGAFIGSLIGVVCIVLLGQWGYVASLSGVVMGFCALTGYQLLGRTISTKGIVICSLLMIVMVFISNQIGYGLAVAEVYETDAITGFAAVPMLLAEGGIETDVFLKDLGMLYLFTALGAIPTLKDHFKK